MEEISKTHLYVSIAQNCTETVNESLLVMSDRRKARVEQPAEYMLLSGAIDASTLIGFAARQLQGIVMGKREGEQRKKYRCLSAVCE